jgi:phage baseplate assembly protein W
MANDYNPQPPRDYVGTGWSFPLRINVQGKMQLSSDVSNVEEAIRIILNTKLGERVYRPNFGSRLSELVFAPMNTQTLLLIRVYIEEALELWEPRIILEGIYTEPDPVRGRVEVRIEYSLRDSYETRSMVYPFYLMPSS